MNNFKDDFRWDEPETIKRVYVVTPITEEKDQPLWADRWASFYKAQAARLKNDEKTYLSEKQKVRDCTSSFVKSEDFAKRSNPVYDLIIALAMDLIDENDFHAAMSMFRQAEQYAVTDLEKAKAVANQAYLESDHQQEGWYERAVRLNKRAYEICPYDEVPLVNSLSLALKAERPAKEIGLIIKGLAGIVSFEQGSVARKMFETEEILQRARLYPEFIMIDALLKNEGKMQ